ncbi:MAG: flavodoxin [Campylobacteraceae bacterium]|nr:flavodoxin [Campylobacteraceae bacterium]
MSIAITYGSTSGNTKKVAKKIAEALGKEVAILDVAESDATVLNSYDTLILGTSTWYGGELQDDWDSFDFEPLNLSGKKVALFGLGDTEAYGDEFCDAMGILYDICIKKGANIIGDNWPIDGYGFEYSNAVRDGFFVGLAIDEENQEGQTKARIEKWVKSISALV